jgi:xanthine/uracil permease
MQIEYGLDQRVPFIKSWLIGSQWAAVIVSSIIILGKVIGELHFGDSVGLIIYLQKLLFLNAATLLCQVFWGHRLPVIPGPSAVLLIGVIASQGSGISAIYTSVVIGGLFISVLSLSGLFRYLQRLFTVNVVTVVLLLIAFTIAPTIRDLIIAEKSGTTPFNNISFALVMVILMFLFYRLLTGIWKSTLIIWAMLLGSLFYLLIFPGGKGDGLFCCVTGFSGFFEQMTLGLSFQPGVLISFIFCFIALSINDLGSIQAVRELIAPSDMEGRVTRGVFFTGLANIASGFFGVIGPVNYSLSPGMILSTRCASRFTLVPAAAIMLLLAFFPAATGVIGNIPSVVIGAVLAYVMTHQISAGLTIAFKDRKDEGIRFDNGLVIGLPLLLGTVVAFFPGQVVSTLPQVLRPILGNGFVVGVLSALILEHMVFRKKM